MRGVCLLVRECLPLGWGVCLWVGVFTSGSGVSGSGLRCLALGQGCLNLGQGMSASG